jgi:hypothetical protein
MWTSVDCSKGKAGLQRGASDSATAGFAAKLLQNAYSARDQDATGRALDPA